MLIHGWPGSFLEFTQVIHLLTHPSSPDDQAFHVVVPSQPGFAFSDPPVNEKWRMEDTARVFDKLMTGLHYNSYAAQGGDWGSITARILGSSHSNHCKAVHLNFCPAPASPSFLSLIPTRFLIENLPSFLISDLERKRGQQALKYLEKGSAYYAMQANTVGFSSLFLFCSTFSLTLLIILAQISLELQRMDLTILQLVFWHGLVKVRWISHLHGFP
jgi:pimeloyl-ACP methyl ester carboxylesterase